MHHLLKVHPQFWDALKSGAKPFEVRRNDRKFAVGDTCDFRKFDPSCGFVAEHGFVIKITYILAHEDFPNGVPQGYVVLGFGQASQLDDGR